MTGVIKNNILFLRHAGLRADIQRQWRSTEINIPGSPIKSGMTRGLSGMTRGLYTKVIKNFYMGVTKGFYTGVTNYFMRRAFN